MNSKIQSWIIAICVMVIIACLGYGISATIYASGKKTEITQLNEKVEILNGKVETNERINQVVTESASLSNDIGKIIADEQIQDSNVALQVRVETLKQLEAIEKKYMREGIELTVLEKANKDRETRQVRVGALWVSYCIRYPKDYECLKN